MKRLILVLLPFLLLLSCKSDDTTENGNNNNKPELRTDILRNLAQNYIVPAVKKYNSDVTNLEQAWLNYKANLNSTDDLIEKYHNVQISFQAVEVLKIGTISQNDFTLNSNIYPIDASEIEEKISASEVFNPTLPSNISIKGLASLDYLFFGDSGVEARTTNENYVSYVDAVISDLKKYADLLEQKWNNDYTNSFIANNGSGVNSSLDDFTNQLIYFYEKRLRAGKVGIPAGVFSDLTPLPNSTETLYEKGRSRTLLAESLRNFSFIISGADLNGNKSGVSLLDYADAVKAKASSNNLLSKEIEAQLNMSEEKILSLNSDLSEQVVLDNSKMVETFDQLQKLVSLLKVDLVQSLGISITYVDADGD